MEINREDPEKVNYFAESDYREKRIKFGIKAKDRLKHMYVIGKTGMGKSTMLENMAAQDILNGNGMCFMDPHGASIEILLQYVPADRVKDVIYFAPFDIDNPISFNVLEDVGKDQRHLVVSGLMSTFKKIWFDAWSARMEHILQNTLLALLEYPGATLLGVNRMYTDKAFRDKVIEKVTDPGVKSFWVDEFTKYTERFAAEATPAIQNKIGQFTNNPLIRNIIGQPTSSFDFRDMLDSKKILLVNLSKGRIGEGNASLLGSMLITKIYLAAMSRADSSKAEIDAMPSFYFFVDEFQSFANESFADILSEARKYKLSLTIAHQYVEQMPENVRNAVFGNVGTTATYRVGPLDAEIMEKIMAPKFSSEDIVGLGLYQMYLSLMIDGVGSPPFSAKSLPPLEKPLESYVDDIVKSSRGLYSKPREEVEHDIAAWHVGEEALRSGKSTTDIFVKPKNKKKKKKKAEGEAPENITEVAGEPESPRREERAEPSKETKEEANKDLGSNDLKSLLAAAMSKKPEVKEVKKEPKKEKVEKPKEEERPKDEPKTETKTEASMPEIPEEELKKMLEVE